MTTTTAKCLYYTNLWVKLVTYWIEKRLDESSSNAAVSKATKLLDVNWIGFDAKLSAVMDWALPS